MCDATGLSQRCASRLTGLSLTNCRYDAQRPAADAHLSGRIDELAIKRTRRRKGWGPYMFRLCARMRRTLHGR